MIVYNGMFEYTGCFNRLPQRSSQQWLKETIAATVLPCIGRVKQSGVLLLCVQLNHVTLEDAGVYTVTARNIAGCVSTSAILVVGHGLRQLLLSTFIYI